MAQILLPKLSYGDYTFRIGIQSCGTFLGLYERVRPLSEKVSDKVQKQRRNILSI